jgi:signal transduction histidine kinase/CheY-like chemotaxis protein/ligand-binding sensor domain-containing protein
MHIGKLLQFVILFQVAILTGYSQQGGLPFIRNYSPQEYKTSPQNWSIAQDQHGLIYFGNNDGVLEFDGVSWNLIKVPGVSPIAIDSIGHIFVGLDNDIGYIKPDEKGINKFISLKSQIPDAYREINLCYRIHIMGGKVIFQTSDNIYIYDYNKISVIHFKENLAWSFAVNNRFYIPIRGKGLFTLQDDSLMLIKGGELFKSEQIISMLPYQKNGIMIATANHGIMVYSSGNQSKLIKPEGFVKVDNFLQKNIPYCGIQLANYDYAIGTIAGGIIVFSSTGEIKNIYNKNSGLQDNSVYWLYSDTNQQLWAALDNGISHVERNIPFTQYTDKSGLNGGTMCLCFFDDHFYVGTNQFLYIQNQDGTFEPIEGTESQNFNLFEARGTLLLANLSGVFDIKGKKATPLANTSNIGAISISHLNGQPDYLITGAINGLYLLKFNGKLWTLDHRIKGFGKPAYKIDQDSDGNIWVSTFLDIYRLRLNMSLDSVINVQQCTSKQGLPTNYAMTFRLKSGEIVFCSEKGVYKYLNNEDRFISHPDFQMLTGKVTQFVQIENGDIYFEQVLQNGNYEKGVLRSSNGKYAIHKTAFDKFNDISTGDCPYNVHSAPDGTVFFGTGYGLLQYDPSIEENFNNPFNTIIRSVLSNDTLLFGGERLNYPFAGKVDGKDISYSQNNLVFNFAATFYENSEKNLYSYRLLGSEKNWSPWTTDHKKEYTNLPEGRYIFQVKSKNQYQVLGSTDSYAFTILPPWYHTGLAFVLYFFLFVAFLFLVMKLYTRRLGRQKTHLARIVDERTGQVLEQKKEIQKNNEVLIETNSQLNASNKELNQTNEKLRATLDLVNAQKEQIEVAHIQITNQNKELNQYRSHLEQLVEERTSELLLAKNKAEESDRLKTAFLQNMSHEIRTPMNGILGFLELLREPDLDDINKNNYINIINDSGQRLLNTINDIIELSRIESNQLSISYSEVDITEMMNYHYNFFKLQAEEKGLKLKLSAKIQDKKAAVETDKKILDNILINLINNAIKFTKKGTVEFGNYLENDSMIFFVKDSGIGIPHDRLEAIFDRFVQADMKNTRTHEGSGLGLSIVKGYLELLNGSISVESEPGQGSTFRFSVPYQPVKIKPSDIIEKNEPEHSSKKKLTLLVVEDDENSYLFIKSILKNFRANFLHAVNGNDAVKFVKENPGISLVLMDIKMPELNGFDATRNIREFNSTIPIIVQSAYAFAAEKEEAFRAGCNDYITKPLNVKELIQLVRKYTENDNQ